MEINTPSIRFREIEFVMHFKGIVGGGLVQYQVTATHETSPFKLPSTERIKRVARECKFVKFKEIGQTVKQEGKTVYIQTILFTTEAPCDPMSRARLLLEICMLTRIR